MKKKTKQLEPTEQYYECKCGNEISEGRWNLGRHNCLSCGDVIAKDQMEAKSKRVVLMHKSNPIYAGSDDKLALETFMDCSNMRRSSNA